MDQEMKELGIALRNLADTLAHEHGYLERRDGHDITSCQTCADIRDAYDRAAAVGAGDFDYQFVQAVNVERLRNALDEDLRDELHQLGYDGVDELGDDTLFDKLVEYYELYPDKIPD